jgi:hypothetical protein
MSKKASKSVYASTNVVFPYPLSPSPSTFSVMNNLYNTEVDPDDPETANEGDMQTEYSCL